jgi:hypothetical protein
MVVYQGFSLCLAMTNYWRVLHDVRCWVHSSSWQSFIGYEVYTHYPQVSMGITEEEWKEMHTLLHWAGCKISKCLSSSISSKGDDKCAREEAGAVITPSFLVRSCSGQSTNSKFQTELKKIASGSASLNPQLIITTKRCCRTTMTEN